MSIPSKDHRNAWSVAIFESQRTYLTNFVRENILPLLESQDCLRTLVEAPVKSGKREFVEYIAMRDKVERPNRVHGFISSFHRTADERQRKEMALHNIEVFSLTSKTDAHKCIQWINVQLGEGKQVVLHIDECDFGSSDKQVLCNVYSKYKRDPRVYNLLYSATPPEVLYSGEVEEETDEFQGIREEFICDGQHVRYIPPPTFCGPATFLDRGLVTEAKPFFTKTDTGLELSSQGREILEGVRNEIAAGSRRNVVVLRLSYSDLGGTRERRKENKAIYQFLKQWSTIPELQGCFVYTDKGERDIEDVEGVLSEKINWSDKEVYWASKRTDVPLLFVIDQTSSRSTEWACHDRVYAYHDYRNVVTYSVVSQAQERVNHYEGKYGGFQPIKVYGHQKTFELSARRITYTEYLNNPWKAKKVHRRTATARGLEGDHYEIVSTEDNRTLHTTYRNAIPATEVNNVLQALNCFVEVKVSPRVRGGSKLVPVYGCRFEPCEPEAYPAMKRRLQEEFAITFNRPVEINGNVFTRSLAKGLVNGRYQGYVRGWRVFEYAEIERQPGFGVADGLRITVCYRNGQIGLAVRWDTGEKEEKNTLETFRSMYGSADL